MAKVRATFSTLSFEFRPGVWTDPLPYWFFETGKDGTIYLIRPTITA